MAKYIANVSGKQKEVQPITTSAGAGDASKMAQTDSTGRWDISLMPPGVAAEVTTAVASEALTAGDFVNLWNNAGVLNVRKADATSNAKPADGFVIANVSSSGTATVYGISTKNTGLTGLTIGSDYWLSTTPGVITTTAPSGSGNIVQLLGRAESATAMVFKTAMYYELV